MTTSTEPRLTALQRKILTYTTTLDGPFTGKDIRDRYPNAGAVEEAILTLVSNGLVEYDYPDTFTVTPAGRDRADRTRAYDPSRGIKCRACIRVACVCIARIECLGDGPHSLGCHGSHE